MKSWKDGKSPWGTSLRFDAVEFETMMDELRERAGGGGFIDGRGVDIDHVLLEGLGIEPDFVDLPPGVMGRTRFHPNGRAEVEISRTLADLAESDVTARRRLRSTLAHECGHIACHSTLFIRDTATLQLFPGGDQGSKPPIMCRESSVTPKRYNGEWWEYQANQCMAALLLPKTMFKASIEKALAACGCNTFEEAVREGKAEGVLRWLSKGFDVSLEATFYRLQAFGYVPEGTQAALHLGE